MYRVFNEYLSRVELKSNNEIYERIKAFLKECEDVKNFCVNVNFNRYVIDIKLKYYSVKGAEELFASFNKEVSYGYSSLFVRFNEGSLVRYRYLTSNENKEAFYCDIVIS